VKGEAMTTERKDLNSYTLTSEEIEKLLQAQFGDKIAPMNRAKLAKQNLQRMKNRARQ
jgi:hypothetical protein